MTVHRRITERDIEHEFGRYKRLLVQAGVPQDEVDRIRLRVRDIPTVHGNVRETYGLVIKSAYTEIASYIEGLDDIGIGRDAYRALLAANASLAIVSRSAVY